MKKRILLIGIFSLLLAAATGCGNTENTTTEQTPVVEEESKQEQTIESTEDITVEKVTQDVQGTWNYPAGGAAFIFDGDSLSIQAPGMSMKGTYEVKLENSSIVSRQYINDASTDIQIFYKYENDTFVLLDNTGAKLVKQ